VIASHALDASRLENAESHVRITGTIDEIPYAKHGVDAHRFQRIEYSRKCSGLAVDVSDDTHSAHLSRADHDLNLGGFHGRAKMCVRLVEKGLVL
jgi:hypothetical protein